MLVGCRAQIYLHAHIPGTVSLFPEGPLQIYPVPLSLQSGLLPPSLRVPVCNPAVKTNLRSIQLYTGRGSGDPKR